MKTVAEKLVDFLKEIENNMKSPLYHGYTENLFHQAFGAVTYTRDYLAPAYEQEYIVDLWENEWRARLANLI